MSAVAWPTYVGLLVLLIGAALLWQLSSQINRRQRQRILFEHALKFLLDQQHRTQATAQDALAKTLRLSRRSLHNLLTRMESAGLVLVSANDVALSAEGERCALHVVRAHRLYECYLAGDANMPLDELHDVADRAEHRLTSENVTALDAHLGYPRTDPHGAPIPNAAGEIETIDVLPLTDWPLNQPGTIVTIEDEPREVFAQIMAQGLRPGMNLHVLHKQPACIIVSDNRREYRLAPAAAAKIQIGTASREATVPTDTIPLSALSVGQQADVVHIDPACQGLRRRRLLDLGITPGATIAAELANAGRSATAYRLRGTLIALRKEHADQVAVRPRLLQHNGSDHGPGQRGRSNGM